MNAVCPPKSKLKSLSHGLLSEEESGELLQHLDGCDDCQQTIELVESADDSLINQIKTGEQAPTQSFENEAECKIAGVKALAALGADVNALTGTGFELPKQIGDYEIVRPLGRGGMGQVYLGRHSKLERLVAIKCIATHRQFDENAQQRFAAEMKHIGSLSHPNIVQAFDARESDGTAVLVTEFIDGLNVNQIVKRRPALSIGDACKIGIEVCEALEYVDSMDMIHRDVKPSNIMVDKNGQVKLLDLGLARLQSSDTAHELTATGQALGTVDYVAPEQIDGSKNVDYRADIYSLGCTLYKLLTGHAPFATASYPTALAKMNAHVNDQPIPAEGAVELPGKLQKLLSQMLHKSSDKRPQNYDEIKNVLKAYSPQSDLKQLVTKALETEDVSQAQLDRAAPKTSGKKTRRWPWILGIAGGLAGILFWAWMGFALPLDKLNGNSAKVAIPQGESVVEMVSTDPALAGAEVGDLVDVFQDAFWSKETGLIRRSLIAGKKPIVALRPEESNGKKTGDLVVSISLDEQQRAALSEAQVSKRETRLIGYNFGHHALCNTAKLEGAYRVTSRLSSDSVQQGGGACVVIKNQQFMMLRGGSEPMSQTMTVYGKPQQMFSLEEHVGNQELYTRMLGIYEFGQSGKLKIGFDGAPRKLSELSDLDRGIGKLTFDNVVMEIRLERIREPEGRLEAYALAIMNDSGGNQPKISVHFAFEKGEGEVPNDSEEANVEVYSNGERKLWIRKEPWLTNDGIASASMMDYFGGTISLKLSPAGGERFWAEMNSLPSDIYIVDKVNGEIISATCSIGGTDQWSNYYGTTACVIGEGVEKTKLEKWVEQINENKQLKRVAKAAEKAMIDKHANKDGSANLRDLTLAFLNYESGGQSFPASRMVTKKSGKETKPYSWRVALLPLLDQHNLYKQYRFDEQWDSKHNKTLLAKMPDVYRHPSAAKDSTTTGYVGFADDASALQIEKGASMATIPDGTANTLLLVETDSGIPWTKPEDLPFTDQGMARAIAGAKRNGMIFISRADGSQKLLTKQEAEKNLRKMITRAGGEVIDD